MKKLLFSVMGLCLIVASCSTKKFLIMNENIVGQWEEIQSRKTTNSDIVDIRADCDNGINVTIYTFESNGTFFQRNICPENRREESGSWEYEDNVLTLVTRGYTVRYSVSMINKDRVKFSSLSFEKDGTIQDFSGLGFFVVLERK